MKGNYLVLIAILLTSCFNDTKVNSSDSVKSGEVDSVIENLAPKDSANKDSVLIEQKITHTFSQSEKKDEFYAGIKGKSMREGKLIFKIISYNGKELLNEEFPSNLLINNSFQGDINSVKETEDFMIMRIKEFSMKKTSYIPQLKWTKCLVKITL